MKRVRILPSAWDDLDKIENWYLKEFGVETALKVSSNLLSTIDRLEIFPDSGSLVPDEYLNALGYRMVICKKHVAIFKKEGEKIYVYHIADSKTDYTELFYGENSDKKA